MKEKIDLAKLIKDRINIIDIIGKEEKLIKSGVQTIRLYILFIMKKHHHLQ